MRLDINWRVCSVAIILISRTLNIHMHFLRFYLHFDFNKLPLVIKVFQDSDLRVLGFLERVNKLLMKLEVLKCKQSRILKARIRLSYLIFDLFELRV